jgi:hypothetical protein
MKNTDIENFYRRIDGHIKLIAAYTGEKYLPQIIRSFRLKPNTCFDAGFDYETRLEYCWCDEFGNAIRLAEKQLKLSLCDIKINQNAKTCTDLFYGNSVKEIANKSKYVLIATGDYTFAAFYGIDEFIRAFVYDGAKWISVSPLVMGINTAKIIFDNMNKAEKKLDKDKLDFVMPFEIENAITTPWTEGKDIVSFLHNKTGEIVGK